MHLCLKFCSLGDERCVIEWVATSSTVQETTETTLDDLAKKESSEIVVIPSC
jgi:hypothetical protein